MGEKRRLSYVVDYEKHIKPYRIVEIVSGVGSGKNYWVENELMNKMRVLLISSRKAKIKETEHRIGVSSCINLNKRKKDALNYFFTEDRTHGSCVCNNWQIEYYMNNVYISGDEATYLWRFFDIIIVDECHSLATDATYADAPFYVLDFIRGVYKQSNIPIVLMTATPAPIDGMLNIKKKEDYHYWDFTKECINLLPEKLWYQTTEQTLNEMVNDYKRMANIKSRWVYFATRTSTMLDYIVPFLVNAGIPEEEIAVSFSKEVELNNLSKTLLKNKVRVEEYLKTHEDIPEDIKFFITTSKNKEGINIDNPNYYWDVAIESHWTDEVAQIWGRIRHGLNQHGDDDKSPTNKVVIVYDAKQHAKHYVDTDYSVILSYQCIEDVNLSFNHWCNMMNIPSTNRMQNQTAKKEIQRTIDMFPYLRYSVVNDKFYMYKGKVLGEKSFAKSVDNFKAYISDCLDQPIGMTYEKPFSIQSFFIMPPQQTVKFEDYIRERGYLSGTLLSEQDQFDMLEFISETLNLRQKSNPTKKYTTLSKALSVLGYSLKQCSHHTDSELYRYRELIKNKGEDFPDSIEI